MNDLILEIYRVGRRYQRWKKKGVFSLIEYDGNYFTLVYGVPGPTRKEIKTISEEDIAVTATVIDDVLFFLGKYGEVGYVDSAFEPCLYDTPFVFDPDKFDPGQGVGLATFLVDSRTGEIQAMRLFSLTHILTQYIFTHCREREKQRETFNKEQYQQTIQRIYQRYPTSDLMFMAANPNLLTIYVGDAQD